MSKEGRNADRFEGRLHRQTSQYRTATQDDPSKLRRQQSQRITRRPDRDSNKLYDPSKLARTSTFHQRTSNDSPSVSRKSSHYSGSDSLNDPSRLTRKLSLRHNPDDRRASQLTEAEKKERKRRQNTESARRTRERRRAEMERLEKVYDANEIRIKELELMADELSRELRRHNTISGPRRSGFNFDDKEERPKWFGAPF